MQDQMFTTLDEDNDTHETIQCSARFGNGGWWFGRCHWEHMNGKYYPSSIGADDGVVWKKFTGGNFESLKQTWLMIRPSSFAAAN